MSATMMRLTATAMVVCGLASCSRNGERAAAGGTGATKADAARRLATPYPIEPFQAVDIEGQDRSFSTWQGKVVVVNVWATWCPPCRREIPALTALQDKYRHRLLVVGLLQDNVTTDFARAFARSVNVNYPIVRSTFDIEAHFPQILLLPMTFVVDTAGRLVAMHAGEFDPAVLQHDIEAVLPRPR